MSSILLKIINGLSRKEQADSVPKLPKNQVRIQMRRRMRIWNLLTIEDVES